jgi:hypothetical protein
MAGRVWTISGSCPIDAPCCAMRLYLAKTSPLQQAACRHRSINNGASLHSIVLEDAGRA